jgi:hypothetical protein
MSSPSTLEVLYAGQALPAPEFQRLADIAKVQEWMGQPTSALHGFMTVEGQSRRTYRRFVCVLIVVSIK